MVDLRDRIGPANHYSNDTHEPAIVTAAVDPSKVPAEMKNELAELCVVRAQCRECDDSSLYFALPNEIIDVDCKNDACSAKLLLNR